MNDSHDEAGRVLELRALKVKLARRERRAHERLMDLQCELDRVTTALDHMTARPQLLAGLRVLPDLNALFGLPSLRPWRGKS